MAVAIPMVMSMAGAKIAGMAFGGSQLAMGIGWMAGGMLGSMLFPQKSDSHKMPQMAEYPVQSSSRGMPVPIIYGTRKVAGNIIWLGDLESNVVVHKASGGKAGGGGGGETQEIRYRRSFLIAICEGPANIMRIWEGKTQISIEAASIYNGLNNSGIPLIVDEDYGEYEDVLCAYFESYELGNSQQLPNFTFEVQAGPIDAFFTGCDIIGSGSYSAAKCRPNGLLDETFATDGIFKFEYSPAGGTNAICESAIDSSVYVVQGHPNIVDGYYAGSFSGSVGIVAIGDTVIGSIGAGRFSVEDIYYKPATNYGLVWLKHISGPFGAANEIYDDGAGNIFTIPNFANRSWKKIAKLTARGKLDKSWGEGGYKWIAGTIIGWLIEDKDGNTYGGVSLSAEMNSIFSLDQNGKHRWMHGYVPGTRLYPEQSYAAVLSQDQLRIYIACDLTSLGGVSSKTTSYNVMKLRTSDGGYDTTWSTNGRFMQGSHYAPGGPNAFSIVRIHGTEKIAFHHQGHLINSRRYSITKLTAGGARDTSWGENNNGMAGHMREPVHATWTHHGSLISDETKRVFSASYLIDGAGVVQDSVCYVTIYDQDGEITYSFTVQV